MRRRAGFTLLEMLVATLIMGIAVVGTLSAISTATRNGSRLMEHDLAVLLARSKLNELIADPNLPRDRVLSGEFSPVQAGGRPAGWLARVGIFDRPPRAGPGTLVLDRIELEVWWSGGAGRRTFALSGYRMRMLTQRDFPPSGAVP